MHEETFASRGGSSVRSGGVPGLGAALLGSARLDRRRRRSLGRPVRSQHDARVSVRRLQEVTSWGPGTDTSANTCNEINISTHTWDLYGYVYYFEVTLTRTSTSTNPQFHAAQLHP